MRACFANASPTPFNLYVAIAADGAHGGDDGSPDAGRRMLRRRAPHRAGAPPPFAPFHAQMEMRFGS
jgi:hypothetical protein